MRYIFGVVASLLAVCLALRLAAWLVKPVIPLLAVLAAVSGLLVLVIGGRDLS